VIIGEGRFLRPDRAGFGCGVHDADRSGRMLRIQGHERGSLIATGGPRHERVDPVMRRWQAGVDHRCRDQRRVLRQTAAASAVHGGAPPGARSPSGSGPAGQGRSGSGWSARARAAAVSSSTRELSISHSMARRLARAVRKACQAGSRCG
jgi:hypothetical protein